MNLHIYQSFFSFAAIKHETVEEKQSVFLPCPHSVVGEVTWSRETNGHRVDILTVEGDGDKKHIPDPGRRYSSLADKSLHMFKVTVSDSGTYLCNNESAVELTVIPSGNVTLCFLFLFNRVWVRVFNTDNRNTVLQFIQLKYSTVHTVKWCISNVIKTTLPTTVDLMQGETI